MTAVRRGLAALLAVVLISSAGAAAQEESELDRFMAQVLEQQARNAASSLDYVLDVLFESGNWYLVGREVWDGRSVLRIEYYPERLAPPSGDEDGSVRDAEIDAELGKVLLVTLWVDPVQRQIVRYAFDNLGFAFLPGRWLVRLEDAAASMSMRQPFPDVWLPAHIEMRAVMRLSTGRHELRLTRTFANYREAVTGGRLLAAPAAEPR